MLALHRCRLRLLALGGRAYVFAMKKTKFPRVAILDRQQETAKRVLELKLETVHVIRGGDARYGLPQTRVESRCICDI